MVMDGSQGGIEEAPLEPAAVRRFLSDNPDFLTADMSLLDELGLKVAGGNVVEFGPVAIARVSEAHQREASQRQLLEETARANFSAQAQTHGAVIDLLDARNHSDLARRIDELVDLLLGGPQQMTRMGFVPTALGLFGDRAGRVASMAMVRMAIWEPSRQGLLAFGSMDPNGFTEDMGTELVAFLARVVERTAERWPLLEP
jgi:hypothetical protein